MATAEAEENIAVRDQVRAVRQRGKRLAALAETLFAKTKHLHGLTKTSLRMLRAAAAARALMLEGFAVNGRGKRDLAGKALLELSPLERSIALTAAAGLTCDDVPERHLLPARSRKMALTGVTLRIAALLDLAEGLDADPERETQINAVVDDGESLRIEIDGAKRTAETATDKAELWNCTALRPIAQVVVADATAESASELAQTSLVEAAQRLFRRTLEQLIARQYGLAYADDLEYVHEMRVAIRRLRAAMRVFGKAFVGELKAESDQLRELANLLGEARDADVFLDFLRAYRKSRPREVRAALKNLIRVEHERRVTCYRRLMSVCRSSDVQEFLGGLYRAVRVPAEQRSLLAPAEEGLSRTVAQGAVKGLRKSLKRTLKFGSRLERLSGSDQHALRIACKKLRYAGEFFTDIYPAELRGLIDTMVRLQDLLGQAHDADVYIERLTDYFEKTKRRKASPGAAQTCEALRRHLRGGRKASLDQAAAIWKKFTARRTQKRLLVLIKRPLVD